jgi:hypothetical protein
MDKQCFVNWRKRFLRKHCHVLQQKMLFRGEYIYMVLKNKFISYSSVFNYELMASSLSLSLAKKRTLHLICSSDYDVDKAQYFSRTGDIYFAPTKRDESLIVWKPKFAS